MYNNVNYFLISYSVECGRSWVRLVRIKPGICSFSDKHSQLRNKSKYWLARNQIDISEWSDMFSRGLLFQSASTVNIPLSVLALYKADISSSSHQNVSCSRHDISEKLLN